VHVGIITDHPKRDLAGAVMTAAALGRRGYRSSIIPLYEQAVDVPLLGLDALIVNFARPANIELVAGYRALGLPVYVLDTEGGVLTESGANSPEKLARFVRSSGFSELLAGYLFWGSTLRDAFVRLSGLPADRLHVTGCPRFDFASPRWWELLDFDRTGYVLVNANFPLVNPLFVRSPEDERNALVAAGWDRDYVDQMLVDLRRILAEYLVTVRAAAARFKETTIVVRPHPFERSRTYEEAFEGLANVVVDGRGSVMNVIRNSRCVVHLNCGTSIEATMLRRVPLSLEFLNTPLMARHGPLPSRISLRTRSAEHLFDCIEHSERAAESFPFEANYGEHIRPWFHDNDGAAADRIVNALVADLGTSRGPRPSVAWSLRSSRRKSRISQRLQAIAANTMGSALSSAARGAFNRVRREKRLDVEAVRLLLGRVTTHEAVPVPGCQYARHPWTGAALASISVVPSGGSSP
jgi:surface carbohydrate biosynthesis protein